MNWNRVYAGPWKPWKPWKQSKGPCKPWKSINLLEETLKTLKNVIIFSSLNEMSYFSPSNNSLWFTDNSYVRIYVFLVEKCLAKPWKAAKKGGKKSWNLENIFGIHPVIPF